MTTETQEQPQADIVSITERAANLIKLIKVARDDTSKRRAAVAFMSICDTLLTSQNRIGALLVSFAKEIVAAGLDHKSIIGTSSPGSITSDQRHYIKTMALVIMNSHTPTGREQIRKNGLNYQELERVVGSDRFNTIKSFLSGD
jgi:hypothetical protein